MVRARTASAIADDQMAASSASMSEKDGPP